MHPIRQVHREPSAPKLLCHLRVVIDDDAHVESTRQVLESSRLHQASRSEVTGPPKQEIRCWQPVARKPVRCRCPTVLRATTHVDDVQAVLHVGVQKARA